MSVLMSIDDNSGEIVAISNDSGVILLVEKEGSRAAIIA